MYIILTVFIIFVPGFAIAGRFRTLSRVERLAVSFGFSSIILALLVPFFTFGLGLVAQLFLIVTAIVSLWYLLKNISGFKFDGDLKYLLFVLFLGLISKFFLQALWDYPVMGGDWFGHTFGKPYKFDIGDWSPDRDRTPLFSLLIFTIHKLLGTSLYQFWISQIISVVINSIYMIPAFLIAKKVYGDWVAKVSALFMLVTPFLIFNTLYTWPKNAAMYAILMMIYFIFFSEHEIKLRYSLAGFFAGLGFWFHNYTVFYIGIAVLLLIYREKMYKVSNIINLKKTSYFFIALLLVLAPYLLWVFSYYGTFVTSRFIYYPFAVTYDLAVNGTTRQILDAFHDTPVGELIANRIVNAVVTLTPAALPFNPIARSFHTYNPIFYYTHDYPGALSFLMYFAVVIWFLKYITGKRKTNSIIVSFIVFPLFINLILWGWRDWGFVGQMLSPTVPLLIILGTNEFSSIKSINLRTLLTHLLFIGALVEGLIFSKLIVDFYNIEGGLENVSKAGLDFTPEFQISNFISAHFLLYGNIEISALISAGIIILAYIFLNRKLK